MSGYIGSTPVPQATQHRESFTATEGQTSFATAGYTPQFVDVYLNGSHLSPADFTASNGSDVVLGVAASADDVCDIISYTPFEVADATFTGTTNLDIVDIDGTLNASGLSYVNSGNGSGVALKIGGEGGAGLKTQYILASGHTNYQIGVATHAASVFSITPSTSAGNTTFTNPALNINASGNVGIGVNDPDATLDISGGSNKLGILRVTQRASGAAAYGLDVGLDSSTGDPVFSRIVNDTATEALRITRSSGLVTAANGLTLTDGNLVVASGHGIDFSATGDGAGTDSSELLDDYEEGAWTPSFSAGGTSISYDVQFGKYTKIGRIVYAELYIQGSITGNGQQVQVQGLPYNVRNENYARGGGMVGFESFVGTATPQFYGAQNTATFALYREGDLGFTIANGTSISSKYLIGVFVYPTAT